MATRERGVRIGDLPDRAQREAMMDYVITLNNLRVEQVRLRGLESAVQRQRQIVVDGIENLASLKRGLNDLVPDWRARMRDGGFDD